MSKLLDWVLIVLLAGVACIVAYQKGRNSAGPAAQDAAQVLLFQQRQVFEKEISDKYNQWAADWQRSTSTSAAVKVAEAESNCRVRIKDALDAQREVFNRLYGTR